MCHRNPAAATALTLCGKASKVSLPVFEAILDFANCRESLDRTETGKQACIYQVSVKACTVHFINRLGGAGDGDTFHADEIVAPSQNACRLRSLATAMVRGPPLVRILQGDDIKFAEVACERNDSEVVQP